MNSLTLAASSSNRLRRDGSVSSASIPRNMSCNTVSNPRLRLFASDGSVMRFTLRAVQLGLSLQQPFEILVRNHVAFPGSGFRRASARRRTDVGTRASGATEKSASEASRWCNHFHARRAVDESKLLLHLHSVNTRSTGRDQTRHGGMWWEAGSEFLPFCAGLALPDPHHEAAPASDPSWSV